MEEMRNTYKILVRERQGSHRRSR